MKAIFALINLFDELGGRHYKDSPLEARGTFALSIVTSLMIG